MPTISEFNKDIRSSINKVVYENIDQANANIINQYIINTMTEIGKKSGEQVAGIVSLTTDINYPGEPIAGTSVALVGKDGIDQVQNIKSSVANKTIDVNAFSFDRNYSSTNGCDPQFTNNTSGKDVGQMISQNTSKPYTSTSLQRHVINGSVKAVNAELNFLDKREGPYAADQTHSDLITPIEVTQAARDYVNEQVSPLI